MRSSMSRRRVALALTVAKAAVLGSLLALTVTTGVGASDNRPPVAPTMTMDSYTREVEAAIAEHDCSTTGFAPDVQPTSALVRTPRGQLRVVSFDRGWEVFTGDRAGLLVAVCLDERRPR